MRWRIFCITLLVWTFPVMAEQITVNYTETTAPSTLLHTTVYWCRGATCTNWTPAGKQLSDNGSGGDAKSVPIQVPLTAGTLPITIRIRVTGTSTTGNETAGAFTTHTFNP